MKYVLLTALLTYYVCFVSATKMKPKPGEAEIHTQTGTVSPTKGEETEIDTGKSFQNQAADKINDLRQLHGSPKLALDKGLTTSAQAHANKIAKTGEVIMSCTANDCKYGENAGMGPPNEKIVIEVKKTIQRWYDSGVDYDYKTGKGKGGKDVPGAFTQLVWKSSTKLGVGAAVNKETNYIYIVAQFSPPGNMGGEFIKNVMVPKSAAVGGSGGSKPKPSSSGSANPKAAPISADEDAATTDSPSPADDETTDSPSPADDETTDSDAEPTNKGTNANPKNKPKPGAPTTGKPGRAYQNQIVDYINEIRLKHHAPPLKLDKSLTEIAQAGAEKSAENGKMSYTCEGNKCAYGENQGQGMSGPNMVVAVKTVVDFWASEEPSYDYAKGKEKPGKEFPGTFTALVWKASTMVGIGAKTDAEGSLLYVVVTFKPPGNVGGLFIKNVLKP